MAAQSRLRLGANAPLYGDAGVAVSSVSGGSAPCSVSNERCRGELPPAVSGTTMYLPSNSLRSRRMAPNLAACRYLVLHNKTHQAPVSGAAQRASVTGRQSRGWPAASCRLKPGACPAAGARQAGAADGGLAEGVMIIVCGCSGAAGALLAVGMQVLAPPSAATPLRCAAVASLAAGFATAVAAAAAVWRRMMRRRVEAAGAASSASTLLMLLAASANGEMTATLSGVHVHKV
jgi:hypothetical protein